MRTVAGVGSSGPRHNIVLVVVDKDDACVFGEDPTIDVSRCTTNLGIIYALIQ